MLVVLAMEGRPPMVETVGLTMVLDVAVEVEAKLEAVVEAAAAAAPVAVIAAWGAAGILGGPTEVVAIALPSPEVAKLGGTTGPCGRLGGTWLHRKKGWKIR